MTVTAGIDGAVVLVTGAGRGIGRAVALAFARAGASVALLARTESELRETAALCAAEGPASLVLPADISSRGEVEAAVASVVSERGRIDAVVNAAGVYGPIGPTAEVDRVAWTKAVEINLFGTFYLCQAVIPHMARQGGGKIILLAGGGATAPLPRFSSYAVAKAGVVRLAETLAEELVGDNIQVNAIAPGLVDTKLQDEVIAAGDRAGALWSKINAARESGAGTVPPEVAAELAVFLASPASGALTGKLIAAPYDPWREWEGRADQLNAVPLYTLRRLDPFTIRPVIAMIQELD